MNLTKGRLSEMLGVTPQYEGWAEIQRLQGLARKKLTSEGLRTVADAIYVDDKGLRAKLKAREFLAVG